MSGKEEEKYKAVNRSERSNFTIRLQRLPFPNKCVMSLRNFTNITSILSLKGGERAKMEFRV